MIDSAQSFKDFLFRETGSSFHHFYFFANLNAVKFLFLKSFLRKTEPSFIAVRGMQELCIIVYTVLD